MVTTIPEMPETLTIFTNPFSLAARTMASSSKPAKYAPNGATRRINGFTKILPEKTYASKDHSPVVEVPVNDTQRHDEERESFLL